MIKQVTLAELHKWIIDSRDIMSSFDEEGEEEMLLPSEMHCVGESKIKEALIAACEALNALDAVFHDTYDCVFSDETDEAVLANAAMFKAREG